MSRGSLAALLLDEVLDRVRTVIQANRQAPLWQITMGATQRGRMFHVTVEIDGELVAEGDARDLGDAQRKALDQFRAWETDRPGGLEHALKVSIMEARRR